MGTIVKFYKLLYDYERDDNVICCTSKELPIDRYDVEKGIELKSWNEKIFLYFDLLNGNKLTDYLANDLAWFIVSLRFKKTLDENKITGIQYLPINIMNEQDGGILNDYYVANIINLVDALDLNHSKYSEYSLSEKEKVISVNVYALKKDKLHDIDVFRLKGSTMAIFVSEKAKRIIEGNGITGCDFLEVKAF